MNDNNEEKVAQNLVTQFNQTLVEDGLAPKTVESYTGDIRAFLKWLESKGNIFTGNLKKISYHFL